MLPENVPGTHQDDYLDCSLYKGDSPTEDGFYSFTEANRFYFSFMENGTVVLRSEGYASEAGRDNGIASVLKNKENDELYKVRQLEDGTWVLVLTAGNNQEIARTCGFATEAEVLMLLPAARANAREALLLQAAMDSAAASTNVDDDYLVCSDYEERVGERCIENEGFICFQHPSTSKFYFAWVSTDNQIILRSEGYPTEAARDKGLQSVINNRDNKDRYKVEENRGLFYLILRAGNNQEIGRSCPKKSEDELWALLVPAQPAPVLMETLAAAPPALVAAAPVIDANAPIVTTATTPTPAPVVPIFAAAAPIVAAAAPAVIKMVNQDKDDDYLLCKEYEGQLVTDTTHNIALFTHANGLHYFVVYHPDGNVKLRSEGFVTPANREEELALVIKLIGNASSYSTIEKAGYEMKVLKDLDGREIGRSCPKRIVAAAPPPPIEMAAPAAPAVSGFKWWYLLPLLLIPLFFLWKSCNKPVEDVAVPVEATTPPVVADTVKPVENVPAPAATTDCSLNWILFDFDKYDITTTANTELQKLITILKDNATYSADLRAFTDAKGSDSYNQNLSLNRANAAKQVLIAAGIDASRIKAQAMSESEPVAKNTDDDSGRYFNRRVELFVLGADGKEVCKSIAPSVPADLKN